MDKNKILYWVNAVLLMIIAIYCFLYYEYYVNKYHFSHYANIPVLLDAIFKTFLSIACIFRMRFIFFLSFIIILNSSLENIVDVMQNIFIHHINIFNLSYWNNGLTDLLDTSFCIIQIIFSGSVLCFSLYQYFFKRKLSAMMIT